MSTVPYRTQEKLMDADREKNLTLTRWFKFSFCSSSFYIPLRSKRNIIDVFVVFKYPAL